MLTDVVIVQENLELWTVSNLARSHGFLKTLKPSRAE